MSPKEPWIHLKMGCGESLLGVVPPKPAREEKPTKEWQRRKDRPRFGDHAR